MLDKLSTLMQAIEPTTPTAEGTPVEDLTEEMDLDEVDDAVHDALAEAQAAAAKEGKELSKEESKTVQRKARTKAMGSFSVVMRNKKVKGKPTLVGGVPTDA